MSWIKIIPYEKASGALKAIYDRIKGPNNYIDNILLIHSQRPHTLTGHMSLYKNVLHHSGNSLEKWFLETLGVYASILNQCEYCIEHHFAGLKRLIEKDRADKIRFALETKAFERIFDEKESLMLTYCKFLTLNPRLIDENKIDRMKQAGISEAEILEVNQVVAYFNYANRTVLGLGVDLKGDQLGLSPSDSEDENSWEHK